MEDILASIRRILSEDEGEATRAAMPAPPPARPPAPPKRDDGVLQLDASMMLPDPVQAQAPPAPDAEPPEADAGRPSPRSHQHLPWRRPCHLIWLPHPPVPP